jgi:arginyl-tRNA synthetase
MIKNEIYNITKNVWKEIDKDTDTDINFQVEIPPKEIGADFAVNICLLGSKILKKSPRDLAQKFIDILKEKQIDKDYIESVSIAGPGFINFILKKNVYYEELKNILKQGSSYGKGEKKKEKILIEFVSSNPTGPLHIGHGRGAAIGDSLAKILDYSGYNVTKEYYVNDAGNQIDILVKSVEIRFKELMGEKIEFPENHYKGSYIIDIAKEIYDSLDDKKDISKLNLKKIVVDKILDTMKKDLKDFGVEFDNWFSESSLLDNKNDISLDKVLDILKQKNYLKKENGAWWLVTGETNHDDKNRVVIREDGRPTYFATDIAYHHNKYSRGFDTLIDIWGADHHGYVSRLKASVSYLGYNPDTLKIILYQLVSLLRNGVKIAMSTRAGEFVTLREVLDEVGKDACRYYLLARSGDNPVEFDLEIAKKHSSENPVYYIQYAHARISSIYREAKDEYNDYINESINNFEKLLIEEEELDIVKMLARFPEIIDLSARDLSSHHLTVYLLDLAGKFHHFYNKHRILSQTNKSLTGARLSLCNSINVIIKNGLNLLGIDAPLRM